METKDRYFHLEYFLTFLLFLPLLFLFPEEAASLRIFLLGGIVLGAAVAYISRSHLYSSRKIATLVASLFILAGTAYFLLKSTFLYREVIVICIKSLALLIIANSFSSCLQGCLNSMQIFSILLFLCVCALARDYSNIFLALTSVFAFNLFAVARIKFYVLFNNLKKAREKDQGINVLFIIVLVLSALLAWILFTNLPLGKIKTWEYLKEEDLNSLEEQEKEKGTPLPEEQIQKELTQLTFKLSSTDEMHRVLAAIQDLLIKDKPFAYEVNKAQKDILEIINNQTLAQDAEKGKELSDAIKAYTNKKISNNLAKIKNGVNKVIEDNHIGLRQRFVLLSSLNKLEYSNSLEAIDRHSRQLQAAVNDPSIPDEASKQLKQFGRQLKEWKAYQVYSRKLDSFQDKINTLDENKKQDFNTLSQQINDVNTISDSNLVDKLIENMRRVSLPEDDKLIDEAEQILKLKKIMLASKENSQLRKKLEDSGQSVDKPPELEDALNAVEESRDAQEIVKKISKLLERMREDNYSQIPQEAKELLEAKIGSLIKDSADALKKQIRESKLPDSGESLLEGLKAMDAESAKGKIADISAEMQKALETFYKQGSITKEIKDSLIKETKKIEQLFIVKSELANMGKQEKSPDKNNPKDYKEKLTDLLQNLPLGSEQKERLKKLLDKLTSAQTVAQVEDTLDALKQELEAATKKENTKEIDKLKELMQQAAEAKKMLLENSSLGDEQKEQINKLMDKMANAKTTQQTEDTLDALKQELEAATKKENTKEIDKLKELMQQAAEAKKMLLENSSLGDEQKEQINKLMDKMANAKTTQQTEDTLDALKQELEAATKKENTKEIDKLKELMQQAAEAKKMLLENSSLGDEQKEQINKLMDKMANAKTTQQTEDTLDALKQELEAATKKENTKEIDKLKELMQQAAEAKKMLLENSSLGDEQKEQINKLMDKMANAKTTQQTEDTLDALKQELEAATKKENTKEIDKLKELMQQAAGEKKMFVVEKDSRSLREKVEDLKKALPQQAALLENNLDQIRESKNRQDLLKSASALKELSESKQFEKKFEETDESLEVSENAQEGAGGIKIDLLPGYAVLPLKSSVTLKSVAIYDNFVKEVAPELEWSSSNPSVAFVNQFGVVYAKGIGEAEITCRYKETTSRKCKVTVVEMISDPELVAIKNELEI